jgi:hypothetical protein
MTKDTNSDAPRQQEANTLATSTPAHSKNENAPLIKRLQEDEWHRQWVDRNAARYRTELAMARHRGR